MSLSFPVLSESAHHLEEHLALWVCCGLWKTLVFEKSSSNDFITPLKHSIKVKEAVIFSSSETATENMIQTVVNSKYIYVSTRTLHFILVIILCDSISESPELLKQ